MKEPDRAPADARGLPRQNLWQTLTTATFLGLLAGLGEGALDTMTFRHYHAPLILCVTLLADFAAFFVLGFALWLLARLFRRNLHPVLSLFILLWAFFSYVSSVVLHGPIFILIASFVIAMLITLYELDHRGRTVGALRKGLPWAVGLALICLIAVPASDAWAERRALDSLPAISPQAPNVVLVIIDTLRADHLSAYGYDRPTSPHIQRLAKQGVLFDTAIAAASWTLPSHASMMTGVYAHVHHADTFGGQLPANLTTLASVMEKNGYRTAAFSANIYFFNRQRGFGRGFVHFGDFFQSPAEALDQVKYVSTVDNFLLRHRWALYFLGRQTAAEINRAALHWIDGSHRPFFLTLNYLDVHSPYAAPQPWRHRFSKQLDPGGRIDSGVNLLPQHLTPAQMQDEINAYDGGVAYDDHEVGRLAAALSKRGLLSNTLLIVTSDHGEALGGHGLIDHANALYFPLIHVPLLFRWPGHIPAGVRVSRPVSTRDIGATILALIHSRPNNFPGRSLAALWNGKANPNSWPLPISELAKLKTPAFFPDHYGPLSSIVSPNMQLILDPRRGLLLYDWKTDPTEAHNLYGKPQYQTLAATLATDMKKSGAQPLPPVSAFSASTRPGGKLTRTGG